MDHDIAEYLEAVAGALRDAVLQLSGRCLAANNAAAGLAPTPAPAPAPQAILAAAQQVAQAMLDAGLLPQADMQPEAPAAAVLEPQQPQPQPQALEVQQAPAAAQPPRQPAQQEGAGQLPPRKRVARRVTKAKKAGSTSADAQKAGTSAADAAAAAYVRTLAPAPRSRVAGPEPQALQLRAGQAGQLVWVPSRAAARQDLQVRGGGGLPGGMGVWLTQLVLHPWSAGTAPMVRHTGP
jgi:hypothetical protein